MTVSPLLSLDNLGVVIDNRQLFDCVSLSLRSGERIALLGESGSGKSMTARAALGLLPSHAQVSGRIEVNGVDVTRATALSRPADARPAMVMQDTLAALNPLASVGYQIEQPLRRGGLGRSAPRGWWRKPVPALQGISIDLQAGERVGLVGMSGCGKSSLLRCLLAMERADAGQVLCNGRAVAPAPVAALRWYRRAVQYVSQYPIASLDPRMSVLQAVAEPLLRLRVDCDPVRRATGALESVGLDHRFLSRRPEELSGGQAQRVAIARAIATRPAFLLADEPVSGLDMTIRAQVVKVLRDLSDAHGTGILMVSHDMSVVANLCQRAIVMDRGRIVEDRPIHDLLHHPHHPHTRELLNAAPPMTAAA